MAVERLISQIQPVHCRKLQFFVWIYWVLGKKYIDPRLAEPQKASRRQLEMIPIPGKARIHPIKKRKKMKLNKKTKKNNQQKSNETKKNIQNKNKCIKTDDTTYL